MRKLLVVVDMQNDFIDCALGTPEAVSIVDKVSEKIREFDGDVILTADTHFDDYLETNEGKHLPVKHCIAGTYGHKINRKVAEVYNDRCGEKDLMIEKGTFGSTLLLEIVKMRKYDYVELIGLCTDICVVSNAILLKVNLPEIDIAVDSQCCAGVTPASHKAALTTMKMCQIEVL